MIYQGAPSRQLPQLAAATRDKLDQNFRCLYLNSPPMVAGMRSYLAAAGVDVNQAVHSGRLLLSCEQDHLIDGRFDVDRMISTLERCLDTALQEGCAGLWAVGDMTWEMGPASDFSELLTYECRLERFFQEHPQLSGVCQYHADILPDAVLRQGLIAHPVLFVNATLSRINPHYLAPEMCTVTAAEDLEVKMALRKML